MADTDILVTSATAVGGVQSITHKATTDFEPGSCLSYLSLLSIEVWSSATNNRAAASLVGTIPAGGQFIQTGLGRSVTRYSWYRAKDVSENLGEFYPVSATGGIAATTSNQVPPAGSVGPDQTASNFSTLSSISGNFGNIIAGSVTGVTFTGGVFRTAASGRRVQITGATNYILIYNSAGAQVGSFGENTFIPGWTQTILSVDINSITAAVTFRNQGTGPALVTLGQIWSEGFGNKAGLRVTHNGTGADAHGFWCDVGPPSNQGGAAIVGVSQAGGSYAFYMNRGSIGPFTGAHDAFVRKDTVLDIGDVLISTGRVLARGNGIDDTILELARAESRADPRVFGVVSRRTFFDPSSHLAGLPLPKNGDVGFVRRYLAENFDRITVNGLGEGQILVCGRGGDIDNGNLLFASDLAGKCERLPPETPMTAGLHAAIVAKATESVTFQDADQVKLVACTYHVS